MSTAIWVFYVGADVRAGVTIIKTKYSWQKIIKLVCIAESA